MDDINATGLEFLLRDIDLAMTMLDLASTTRIEETARRNRENARKAYDSALHFSTKLQLDGAQRQQLDQRMALLKARLDALG